MTHPARAPLLPAAALLAATCLSACTVGPDYQAPSPYNPVTWFRSSAPTAAKLASMPTNQPVDPEWWGIFNDPTLTALMRRVAESNLDVRLAAIRLTEARAQRGIAAANAFPMLNGNASYTREQISDKGVIGVLGSGGSTSSTATTSNGLGGRQGSFTTGSAAGSSGIPPFDLYQYGFDATWEIDLWGRVRRSVESADANVMASAEARRQMLVTSLAELARDYLQLRGAQEDIRIARRNLASAQESARLSDERARGGLATDLDVANARAQVENTAAQLPQLQQQESQLGNAIALLLGAPPGALAAQLSADAPLPLIPPSVPTGLPSELARRRPDIRQAEAQLHAATADIGQAEADFYPRVTLSGSFALQAIQFKDLGSWAAKTYGLGPSISIPIFEGGRLTRTLELRKAQEQEAAVNYQKVVIAAFHEVDNALVAYGTEQARSNRLRAAADQSRRALGLAQQRFRQGISDFLEVLTAQRTVLAAEQAQADSATAIALNLVALYKALGGGWEPFYPQARPDAETAARPR